VRAEPIPAGLLDRLAAHDERVDRSLHVGSYTVTTQSEELDRQGRVEHRRESVVTVAHRDGAQVTTVVRASLDGKDVTAEEAQRQKKREERRKEREDKGVSIESPFARAMQPRHFFWSPGLDAATGLLRIAFRPKGARSDELMEGEALVDPPSGQLVRLHARPSKMPTFVDRADVEMRFEPDPSGARLLSQMSIDGEGGFAFVHRRGRASSTFSQYAP
jgi:hypothetical protein